MNLANLPGNGDNNGSEENSSFLSGAAGEKRTRFSLSHDEGSIGNTSDNLEAISEAASNHSVDSSMEDEVDQAEDPIIDNLSDMVSANVSGRGTPNVSGSGRETPSSQVTDGDELVGRADPAQEENEPEIANPVVAQPVAGAENNARNRNENSNAAGNQRSPHIGVGGGRKSGEPDLEEKFGRFEIKPPSRGPPAPRWSVSSSGAAESTDRSSPRRDRSAPGVA